MKRIMISFIALLFLGFISLSQDNGRNSAEVIVKEVLEHMPAADADDFQVHMSGLAQAAPFSVEILASMLKPAESGANNLIEYAISGLVHYATDPANVQVKAKVKAGLKKAAKACNDKYNRQFLESQLRLMTPPEKYADSDPVDLKEVSKSEDSNMKCQTLWALSDKMGAKSASKMLASLKDSDRSVRTTALHASEKFADEEFYSRLVRMYGKLSDEAKVDVMTWFGDNEVDYALDFAISQLGARGDLGAAAIRTVAATGGEKAADALFAMPVTEDNANDIYKALNYIDVDLTDRIVRHLPTVSPVFRIVLIAVAADKRIHEAAPFIIGLARTNDSSALDALPGVVTSSDFEVLSDMLDSRPAASIEDAIKVSIKSLSAQEKFELMKTTAENAFHNEYFYGIIADSGTDDALAYLKNKYEEGSEDALRALALADNYKVAQILLEASVDSDKFLPRVIDLTDKWVADPDIRCTTCIAVLEKAKTVAVKRYVLKSMARIPLARAFAVAGTYLEDGDLAYIAAKTAKDIAAKTADRIDPDLFRTVLSRSAEIIGANGTADDGYAVDEIGKMLAENL